MNDNTSCGKTINKFNVRAVTINGIELHVILRVLYIIRIITRFTITQHNDYFVIRRIFEFRICEDIIRFLQTSSHIGTIQSEQTTRGSGNFTGNSTLT